MLWGLHLIFFLLFCLFFIFGFWFDYLGSCCELLVHCFYNLQIDLKKAHLIRIDDDKWKMVFLKRVKLIKNQRQKYIEKILNLFKWWMGKNDFDQEELLHFFIFYWWFFRVEYNFSCKILLLFLTMSKEEKKSLNGNEELRNILDLDVSGIEPIARS